MGSEEMDAMRAAQVQHTLSGCFVLILLCLKKGNDVGDDGGITNNGR